MSYGTITPPGHGDFHWPAGMFSNAWKFDAHPSGCDMSLHDSSINFFDFSFKSCGSPLGLWSTSLSRIIGDDVGGMEATSYVFNRLQKNVELIDIDLINSDQ